MLSCHNITQACDAALLMLVMMSSHRFIDPSSVSALRHPRIFTRCAALQPQPCNFHHPVHGLCVTSKDPLDPFSVDGSCCRGRMLSLGVNVYSVTRWLQLRFDCDSTGVYCSSEVIKVTATQPASRSRTDLLIYVGRSAAARS